ncbi:unnamed protein product, partial [marine sediment metagenome]
MGYSESGQGRPSGTAGTNPAGLEARLGAAGTEPLRGVPRLHAAQAPALWEQAKVSPCNRLTAPPYSSIVLHGGTMRRRVYIETTIPSSYHGTRPGPDMVARRQWTREWWERESGRYELVTGLPVLDELERGRQPNKEDMLELVAGLKLLPVEEAVEEIVDTYIDQFVMPADPRGDALHLAMASYHNCHFLLTWNCRHLANAAKFEHIRHVNSLMGLPMPTLTTPVELLYGQEGTDEKGPIKGEF